MTDLAKLVVRLEAQTAKYHAELERANQRLDRFSRRSESAARKVGRGVAAGVAAAGTAIAALTVRFVHQADQLDKLSVRLGISTENLSRLQFAAGQTGVSANTLNTALQRMVRRISEVASTGKGEALPALNDLGISAKKLSQLSPEQQFLALADSFKAVDSQGEKVRLAMKLFDTEGVALLQTMEGGAASVAAFAAESDRLGNTVLRASAQHAATMSDAMGRLQAGMNGAAQEIVKNLGPQMLSAANLLSGVLPTAARIASSAFLQLQSGMLGLVGGFQGFLATSRQGIGDLLTFLGADDLGAAFTRTGEEAQQKANILFGLMEQRFADGLAALKTTVETNLPPLEKIVPSLQALEGVNVSPAEAAQESKAIERMKAENEQILSLQKERFRRLHEEALRAEGLTRQLEEERYARELAQLQTEEDRLRERFGRELSLEQEFLKAREDARTAHENRLSGIEAEASKSRAELKQAELQVAGEFFGALGQLAQEGSRAQRVLFAAEKAAALASAVINLQVAISKANAVGFPQNLSLIAKAISIGSGAISTIRSVSARAMGGPVRAGAPYLVGERGPELFLPSQTGSIAPNHQLRAPIQVTLIEDARRSGAVVQAAEGIQVMVAKIRAELRDEVRSGRGLGQDIQATFGLTRTGSV